MALAAIIQENVFNGLAEDLKKEYKKQSDGTFLLDVAPVGDFALENVKGLKTALASERTTVANLTKQVEAFKDIDIEKAKSALKKVEEMANWKPDDKVREQIEAIKTQLTEKHKGEMSAKESAIQKTITQLQKVMIDAAAIKSLTEVKGSVDLLLPHIRNTTRMRQTDTGDFVVEVIGTDGNARISPAAGSTSPMTIAELVAEMKATPTYAPAFEGTGASGTGAHGGQRGNGNAAGIDFSKLNPTERMKKARELGINK